MAIIILPRLPTEAESSEAFLRRVKTMQSSTGREWHYVVVSRHSALEKMALAVLATVEQNEERRLETVEEEKVDT